ncbi:hypothetical protein [Thermogemmatispora carboxidivorans]|uniref:hypothetical protein n=1 Tax=Thermogemmatispora carboxidivorans TaxID=1382306 RepID=UPI00069A0206|nr:hypothetical protein [Thermogemmatispora carboxidivorans]
MAAIEQHFPSEQLSLLAELESWRKEINRPTYHMHKWWATRLGSVFRAILIGALSEDEQDIWEGFYQALRFPGKVIFDPFMGAGTIIGEALKLGCYAIGADINPVSVFQVRKALEPVSLEELLAAFERVAAKVAQPITQLYQTIDPESKLSLPLLYAFWVMNVPCPACSSQVHLFDTTIFARHAYPQRVPVCQSICLHCGAVNEIRYDASVVRCRGCHTNYDPHRGPARHSQATCPSCQHTFVIVQALAQEGRPPGYHLYALLALRPDGSKVYLPATEDDRQKVALAGERLRSRSGPLPATPILAGHNTDQIRRYQFTSWRQLFNERQLYCLSLLLEAILAEPDEACRELLLLLFSGTLEFNNMLCSYKGEGTGAVRHLFYHHILKPERMALENSVWGTSKSSGCFSTLFHSRLLPALRYRQRPFELALTEEKGRLTGKKIYGLSASPVTPLASHFTELSEQRRALVLCTDSAQVPLPDGSVDAIITDPPYFDFVHYSELADFFYAWLRPALQERYPEFAPETTRSPYEVQQRQAEAFSAALCRVFRECRRVLKAEGLLVFSFHHSRTEGWAAVGEALLQAGLAIAAVHPIKAELALATPKSQTRSPINYDAILVCKHQAARREPLSCAEALATVVQETVTRLRSLQMAAGQQLPALSRNDCFVLAQAQALRLVSRFRCLLRTAPAPAEPEVSLEVSLATFLELVAQEVESIWQQVSASGPATATACAPSLATTTATPPAAGQFHSTRSYPLGTGAQPQPLPWSLQEIFDSLDGKAGNS